MYQYGQASAPAAKRYVRQKMKNMKNGPDLSMLATLALEREDENWGFRCMLKQSDISCEAIDRTVRGLFRKFSSRIRCTECGNCCVSLPPMLKPADVQRLSRFLGHTVAHFTSTYVKRDIDMGGLTFNSTPCPFLSGTSCSVYRHRPADCRSFPHLHKTGFVFRLTQAYSNVSVCPIVFNVYEGLKAKYSGEEHRDKLPNQAL
jgi:Fe-S-cluster containining protein